MVAGVYFGSIFAPVRCLPPVRIVMALAAETNFEVLRYDIPTAFMNSTVDEPIFVNGPWVRRKRLTESPQVMRLRKSLHEIPQASATGTIPLMTSWSQ